MAHREFNDYPVYSSDYVAYFGGEIVNPSSPYVFFCRDNEVIDTLKIDKNNRFFIQFDSLAPGLYTFKHEPEYQYVYFDKNDSIMVTLNSKDFDGSLVFCGRGDQKNNFLVELFLKNAAQPIAFVRRIIKMPSLPIRECHSGLPLASSKAAKLPLPSPEKTTRPAVLSTPPPPPP